MTDTLPEVTVLYPFQVQTVRLDRAEYITNVTGHAYAVDDVDRSSPLLVWDEAGIPAAGIEVGDLAVARWQMDAPTAVRVVFEDWSTIVASTEATEQRATEALTQAIAATAEVGLFRPQVAGATVQAARAEQLAELAVAPTMQQVQQGIIDAGLPARRPEHDARAVGKSELLINVRDLGAAGDDDTDDTAALQAAIVAATGGAALGVGGRVYFPPGTYQSTTLTIPSGVTLWGAPGATIRCTGGTNLLHITGTLGPGAPLAQPTVEGSAQITTTVAHGLAVGDLVYLMSQRDALSADAGPDWRLGNATPSSPGCFFAEFARVAVVNSPTRVTLTSAPVFPGYRPDRTQETAPTARTAATLHKVTPAQDVVVESLTLTGTPEQLLIRTDWAANTQLVDVTCRLTVDRQAIGFVNSVDCDADRCNVYYPPTPAASNISRIAFKAQSSQRSGFRNCYAENASAGFDFTYQTGAGVSAYGYLVDCGTLAAQYNGATTHPGVYNVAVSGGRHINGLRSGISIRSRQTSVAGVTIMGPYTGDNTYGLAVYEGWAQDCVFTGNLIDGFGWGIAVLDAPTSGEQFAWIGLDAADNVLTRCRMGVFIDKHPDNPYRGESGVAIDSNRISKLRTGGWGVYLDPYIFGASINENMIDGHAVANVGIRADVNTTETKITGNTITRFTSHAIEYRGATDPTISSPRIYEHANTFRTIGGQQVALSGGGQVYAFGVNGATPRSA